MIRLVPSQGSAASRHAAWLILSLAAAFSLAAALPCGAAPSPPPRQEPPPQAAPAAADDTLSAAAAKSATRAEAEGLYAAGYRDVEKAKKEMASGKAKDATKHFKKARGKFEDAVKLDPDYFEAWNMLGYSARQAGDLKASFAAYDRCLTIKPDYDEAHEYRGEAYLMSGDIERAKAELAWLRAKGSDEADELAESIEKAEATKPAAATPDASSGSKEPEAK